MRNFTKGFVLLLFSVFLIQVIAIAQESQKNSRDSVILQEGRESMLENIPVISLDESDMQDGSAQNISSQLSAGRDPFLSGASFHF